MKNKNKSFFVNLLATDWTVVSGRTTSMTFLLRSNFIDKTIIFFIYLGFFFKDLPKSIMTLPKHDNAFVVIWTEIFFFKFPKVYTFYKSYGFLRFPLCLWSQKVKCLFLPFCLLSWLCLSFSYGHFFSACISVVSTSV
jgi:hypothetical protein